jgi:hypothetical protein
MMTDNQVQNEFLLKKLHAETIEDVIMIMDEIVRNCRLRESRIAYFTVLYRTTTYMVKRYCDEGGFFEDDERMRRLDVLFANYYFESLFAELHHNTEPPSKSWKATFDAADDPDAVLIQHLLVGMNSHISLDLGVATAVIGNGDLNESLKRDFNRLNDVLASIIHVVQAEIGTVSPLMRLLNQLTLHFENYAVDLGIRLARVRAWRFAEKLTATPREDWDAVISEHDQFVANISRHILSPGWLLQPALWVIRRQEKTVPHEIISGLSGEKWYEEAHQKVVDVIGEINNPHSDLMKRETHLMRVVSVPPNDDEAT